MHPYRTQTCGALRIEHVGGDARLSGWVHRKRDHGQLLFIDLRDHYGITQCVVDVSSALFKEIEQVRLESVVTMTGKVVARSKETVNPTLPTGEVELQVKNFALLSAADPLPLQVNADRDENEEIRLRYRFLDLRRERLHGNIMLRSRVIQSIRRRMVEQGFTEFQTPILTASSPEGARDYLVPSRLHPGRFYALPQAPQQFKQLLMVAGFDRYFQIAPCFRDEDARADRSPGEFYQLDFEMSYVTQEDVFAAIEPVLAGVFEEFSRGRAVTKPPFPRIPFDEALLKYGSDKPDLRNPIVIHDVTDLFAKPEVEFRAFKQVVEKGGVVRAIPGPGAATRPRSWFDRLNDWAKELGAPGLGYVVFEEETVNTEGSVASAIADAMETHGKAKKPELANRRFLQGRGPIAKFLPVEIVRELAERTGCRAGDAVFFVCDKVAAAQKLSGAVRTRLGEELALVEPNAFRFCWIVDFPLYELNEDTGQIEFSHNPFSMPQGGLDALITRDPLTIKAYQYDIVCNGVELSSGAIRNHKPDIMIKAFEIAGYTREQVESRFGGMFNAFKFGAPPHGGSAPGIDRIVMLLADEPNIREVITFPMTQQAEDLLMQAPAPVDPKRLKELHIKLDLPPAKKPFQKES